MAVGIVLGNGMLEDKDGELQAEIQVEAVKNGLDFAQTLDEEVSFAVIIDHIGIFRQQYLDPDQEIGGKAARSLKLSQVHPVLRDPYVPLLDAAGVSPEDVRVITEDVARAFAQAKLKHQAFFVAKGPRQGKTNCRAVMAGFGAIVGKGIDTVHFFEQEEGDRVRLDTSMQGLEFYKMETDDTTEFHLHFLKANGKMIEMQI